MKAPTPKTLFSLLALVLMGATQSLATSDSFSNATVITQSNGSSGTANLLNYTVEAGEPGHMANGGNGAQKSAWWRWTAPANGFCTVDTVAEDDDTHVLDTLVSVYTGQTVNALSRIAQNDDTKLIQGNPGILASSATFYATQGTTYHVAVDGFNTSSVNANNNKVRLRLRHLVASLESRIGAFYNTTEPGVHGTIHLSKTAGHSFTAKLTLAGKVIPFSGVFSLDGYFVTSFERKVPLGATPLPPLTVWLDGTQNGSFGVVTSISQFTGYPFLTVQRFSVAQPNTMKGYYTGAINSGTVSLTASAAGAVTGAAVMPDGTKATIGSSLCVQSSSRCDFPFATSLHLGAGYFAGYAQLSEGGALDTLASADANYFRPAKVGATFYPQGLTVSFNIAGSTYVPPLTGFRALGFLDASMGAGKLSIAEQGSEITPAIMEGLTFSTTNLFKFTTPLTRKPVLTLNKANGLVTGSILDQSGKKRTLTGVLYRSMGTVRLRGHLTGTAFNPEFQVIP